MIDVTTITDGIVPVEPTIVHQGRYRLYNKPDGGMHLVYQRDDKTEPDHFDVPSAIVNLLNMASEGKLSPTQIFSEMMKIRRDV